MILNYTQNNFGTIFKIPFKNLRRCGANDRTLENTGPQHFNLPTVCELIEKTLHCHLFIVMTPRKLKSHALIIEVIVNYLGGSGAEDYNMET